MPNSYDLYLGGQRTTNPDTRAFPSAPFNPNDVIKSAAHKTPINYAITRVLAPGPDSPTPSNGSPNDPAIRNWVDAQSLSGLPLAVNDILRLVILPNGCLFQGFFWEVEVPLAGFTFSIGFSRIGNGAYVAPAKVIPAGTIGTILLATQTAAVAASGFVGCDGTAYTADTAIAVKELKIGSGVADTPLSDCLALRIDALPAGAGSVVFGSLRLKISPIVKELVRGQW